MEFQYSAGVVLYFKGGEGKVISNIKLIDILLVRDFVDELDAIASKYCVDREELIETVHRIDKIHVPCIRP